jgi:hypothetical protein
LPLNPEVPYFLFGIIFHFWLVSEPDPAYESGW